LFSARRKICKKTIPKPFPRGPRPYNNAWVRLRRHNTTFNNRRGARAPCISAEAADASRADDVPGQDEPDHPPDAADGEELVLEVVDVQVPHQVQTHRRHIPHTVPDGVRHVQHVLLVHVPVPRGRGRGQVICHAESRPWPPPLPPSYYYYYVIILIIIIIIIVTTAHITTILLL